MSRPTETSGRGSIWRRGIWLRRANGARFHLRWRVLLWCLLVPVLVVGTVLVCVYQSASVMVGWKLAPDERGGQVATRSRVAFENLMAAQEPPAESALPTLELQIGNNTLIEMRESILDGDPELGHDAGGDRPYHRAYYRDESGQLQKAKIAYRGNTASHHGLQKPSLRVKIRKGDIAQGRRYVELTRPEDTLGIRHRVPEYFAAKLGLMTPQTDVVRLYINNSYRGVYQRSYRGGEPLALVNGRMPGTLFKGDIFSRIGESPLWLSAERWRLFGNEDAADIEHFESFLAAIRAPRMPDNNRRLFELVDFESLAKYAAVQIYTGNHHTDYTHNQMYFLSGDYGRLEPLIWDPICLEDARYPMLPPDQTTDPVLRIAYTDPVFVHRRNEILYELSQGVGSTEALQTYLRGEFDRLAPDLRADMHLDELALDNVYHARSVHEIEGELQEMLDWAAAKPGFIVDYLSDVSVRAQPHPRDPDRTAVQVAGAAAVRVTRRDGTPVVIQDMADGAVPLMYARYALARGEFYYQTPDAEEKGFPTKELIPTLYMVQAPLDQLLFTNAITGAAVAPSRQLFDRMPESGSFHPSHVQPRVGEAVVLGPGVIELTQDIRVQSGGSLTIQPGTTLRLAPGVGIYARGRVRAIGTAAEPIRLEAAGDLPWACFGVGGGAVDSAYFAYVEMSGGSIGRDGGIRYKGMWSVYHCPDVQIRHSRIGANLIGDDAMNLAQSTILVEDCEFDQALSDALDLDMCDGLVRRCRFTDAGNDCLDLMECRVHIQDCVFEGAGDKGVSVGEGTRAVLDRGRIATCVIGMEVKDDARILVRDTQFVGNQLGWHAYQKKWLYPSGGHALLQRCEFEASVNADAQAEKRCTLELVETDIASSLDSKSRISSHAALPQSWQLHADTYSVP